MCGNNKEPQSVCTVKHEKCNFSQTGLMLTVHVFSPSLVIYNCPFKLISFHGCCVFLFSSFFFFYKKREWEEVLKMLDWFFIVTDAGEFGGTAAAPCCHLSCGLKMNQQKMNEYILGDSKNNFSLSRSHRPKPRQL